MRKKGTQGKQTEKKMKVIDWKEREERMEDKKKHTHTHRSRS